MTAVQDTETYDIELRGCFVTCICTSENLLHLRWSIFDEPGENMDDGLTICDRKRGHDTTDKLKFWEKRCFFDEDYDTVSTCNDCKIAALEFFKECGL